jgi:hypothetical protein
MRELLQDVLKQSGSLFPVLKITGTEQNTLVQGSDADKTLFMMAKLKDVIPEFAGQFGIPDVEKLRGFLDHPPYCAEGSSFRVKRATRGENEIVELFEFRDPRNMGSEYRLMAPGLVPAQAELSDSKIPWTLDLQPEKAKVIEFTQMANLFKEIRSFQPRAQDGNLVMVFGLDNSSTHRGNMIFAEGVGGSLSGDLRYDTAKFLAVLKMAGASTQTRLSLTSRGVIKFSVETSYGAYDYYLRAMTS